MLRAQHEALLVDKKQLKASLEELNVTHNELMAHSLYQTEEIDDLRTPMPEPILCLLRKKLLTPPRDIGEEFTSNDTLYHFLCCSPQEQRTLPQYLCQFEPFVKMFTSR